ncbi:cell division protein FtsA [Clostridium sp. JN-9]|uniref:cell division protein FtsA n=1 Tax=Clostridium sp. JN-9 TaxID=2507159 RepID=UPI000FFE0793|nr:cell division protein FtsA [Clostridium sp. JN-9]QAT40115.1 cell division protein FtsA [Clostridium sp. JN-9]
MNEYIIGIDVGSSKICAAAGKFDKNGDIQIVGVTSIKCNGIKKGIVVDIDSTSESIKNCIFQLEGIIDYKIDEVFISLPVCISEIIDNKGVVAVSSEDREIKKSDVERVLKAAKIITVNSDKEIIGLIPEQYIVDGFDRIKDPIGMSGLRLEVDAKVILSQTTVINNLFKSINKADIKVRGIVYEPLALSEVLIEKEEKEIGTAIIDAGAETIDISIFKNGVIKFADAIPYGGNIITNDISVCLKLPFSEAEKIKLKYGDIKNDNNVSKSKISVKASYNNAIEIDQNLLIEIINARVEELLSIINNKIIQSGYKNEISGVTITGGAISFMTNIDILAEKILDKPVRIGVPHFVGSSNPMYSCGIGIVKEASESFKNSYLTNKSNEKKSKDVLNDEDMGEEEGKSGFLAKIKEFFTEFF